MKISVDTFKKCLNSLVWFDNQTVRMVTTEKSLRMFSQNSRNTVLTGVEIQFNDDFLYHCVRQKECDLEPVHFNGELLKCLLDLPKCYVHKICDIRKESDDLIVTTEGFSDDEYGISGGGVKLKMPLAINTVKKDISYDAAKARCSSSVTVRTADIKSLLTYLTNRTDVVDLKIIDDEFYASGNIFVHDPDDYKWGSIETYLPHQNIHGNAHAKYQWDKLCVAIKKIPSDYCNLSFSTNDVLVIDYVLDNGNTIVYSVLTPTIEIERKKEATRKSLWERLSNQCF